MKKVLALIVIMFGLISCEFSNNRKEQKRSLLVTASHLSSTSYHVEIEKYLIKHHTNTVRFETLDSIRKVSDKRCDSILSISVTEIY